jgi:hypothetical protein
MPLAHRIAMTNSSDRRLPGSLTGLHKLELSLFLDTIPVL